MTRGQASTRRRLPRRGSNWPAMEVGKTARLFAGPQPACLNSGLRPVPVASPWNRRERDPLEIPRPRLSYTGLHGTCEGFGAGGHLQPLSPVHARSPKSACAHCASSARVPHQGSARNAKPASRVPLMPGRSLRGSGGGIRFAMQHPRVLARRSAHGRHLYSVLSWDWRKS